MGMSARVARPDLHNVSIRITEVQPNGIRAILLEDGRQGFIRPKETSWERRISHPMVRPKPGDIPLQRDQSIDEELELGDRISAAITRIDHGNHLAEVSLIRRLQEWGYDWDQRQKHLNEIFGTDKYPRKIESSSPPNLQNTSTPFQVYYLKQGIRRLQRILIVDKDVELLDYLANALTQEYKITVDKAMDRESVSFIGGGGFYAGLSR